MNTASIQQKLWTSDSYRRLNDRRRRLAHAVIVEGLSLAKACKQEHQNLSREKRNFDLALCIAEHTGGSTTMTEPGRLRTFQSLRDEVMWAWYEMVDQCGAPEGLAGWKGCGEVSEEACYAAELVQMEGQQATYGKVTLKHAPNSRELDAQKVARYVHECHVGVTEVFDKLAALKARAASSKVIGV